MMSWLPSTTARYLVLAVSFLAVLAALDGLVRAVDPRQGLGLAVTLWVCFGTVYGWLLIEPIVDARMVLRKVKDEAVLSKLGAIVDEVAERAQISPPQFVVYQDDRFDVMTVGIGKYVTIFMSDSATRIGDEELRAILAHEFGHIRLGHANTRLAVYGSLLVMAMISNSTPLVAMLANLFVLWIMRQMEFAADGVAGQVVGNESVRLALRKVGDILGDVPKWQEFFSTHPRFARRISRLL